MGSSASRPSPLAPSFQRMDNWDIKNAKRLLADYKEKDLDFGLDAQGLAEIVSGDHAWAESIIDAFGGTNGIVNVLAFICGAVLVSSGAALEKANLVFDAMDFDMTEQISMDEMTIALLCCARGYSVTSGTGKVPSDEELENVTLQAYRELSKSGGQSITKTEFTKWVLKYIGTASTAIAHTEVTLQDMVVQFGLEVAAIKSISEEVLNELASKNNSPPSQEPAPDATEVEADGTSSEAVELEVATAANMEEQIEKQPVVDDPLQNQQESENHADEQPQQQHHEDEYNEEFQQETPRIESVEDQVTATAAFEEVDAVTNALTYDQADDDASTHTTDEPVANELHVHETDDPFAETASENPVDVNAIDTYDYTDDTYDSSSGLPPPDPFDDSANAVDEPTTKASGSQADEPPEAMALDVSSSHEEAS